MILHYDLYQVKQDDPKNIKYMSMSTLKKLGISFNVDDYDMVYQGNMMGDNSEEVLEKIFCALNTNRPDDFKGHSMSVSDVVRLTDLNGKSEIFFTDDIGWQKIKGFFPTRDKMWEPNHSQERYNSTIER